MRLIRPPHPKSNLLSLKRDSIRGFRIVEEPPHLRQFTARLEEIK
jgi:tryptophanase